MRQEITHIPVDYDGPTVVGLGGFLKNTVTLLKKGEALVSPNLGDMGSMEAVKAYDPMVARMIEAAGEKPRYAAHDLHPNFYTTQFAQKSDMEAVSVQHHHAHVATVMAEHSSYEPIIGASLDGFGLGPDNQSWGGEFLRVDQDGYERLGHFRLLKQPGGDIAAREPWRMGAAVLHELGRGEAISEFYKDQEGSAIVAQMLSKGLNSPETSSCGRLFDAACGLLGVKLVSEFEGEAPMALEAMVTEPEVDPKGWTLEDGVLDLLPVMARLIDMDALEGANLFHGTIAAAIEDQLCRMVEQTGIRTIALCGGCFFNKVMRDTVTRNLEAKGLKVLFPSVTGPGDPGLSLGQAWAVGMKMKGRP